MIAELPLTVRYAIAACVCMARHGNARRPARAIAEATGIPPAFLAKILRQLAAAELIEGERGHGGGYRLARSPDEIVLADVVSALDGHSGSNVCPMGDRACSSDDPCPLHELWSLATAPINQLAQTVTLGRLAKISKDNERA